LTNKANAFGGTFVFFFNAQSQAKKIQKSHQANAPKTVANNGQKSNDRQNAST
jgi:hypothetical protein